LPLAWTLLARWSANGASDSPSRAFLASSPSLGAAVPPSFPPSVVVQVKAPACELPHRSQLPLSRLSLSEIRREVITQGLVAEISGATLWRWLSADALRPWRHRSWIFPRDPEFAVKARRILDVHRAKVFGRCEKKSGIAPVDRLIAEVMSREPYKSARRVFWIMDNCSAHPGQKAIDRLRSQWPNVILVHTPIHASWLNQIEIYFSIVQRKVLTPNDFKSLNELQQRLLAFQQRYEETASPFQWTFTRKDLATLLGENRKQAVRYRGLTPFQYVTVIPNEST
jgi:hypothetical protein